MAGKRIIKVPKERWIPGRIVFGAMSVTVGFIFLFLPAIFPYVIIGIQVNYFLLSSAIIISSVWFVTSIFFFISAKNIVDLEIFENGFIDPFPPFPFTKPSNFISFNEVKKIYLRNFLVIIVIQTKDDRKYYFPTEGSITFENMNRIYERYRKNRV